jgi:hypothetical protein
VELPVHAGRARERAQMRERRWASRVRGSKGARGLERGRRTRSHGRVHSGEIVGERLETADRWGRRDREREQAWGKEWRRQLWTTGQRKRGRGRAQACADRRGPPVRHRGHAGWAKWVDLG